MKNTSDTAFTFPLILDDYRPTRLMELPTLARAIEVDQVFIKLENERPLGNFKILGGMVAALRALARATGDRTVQDLCRIRERQAPLPRLICASDGNHGLAVAFAAKRAGAQSTIYLPVGVSRFRHERIAALGALIVTVEGTYDNAVLAAAAAAARGEGILLPDTTDDVNNIVVKDVMAGYALLTSEIVDQFTKRACSYPTHAFIQAGVGGLAAAFADGFHGHMRQPSGLIVVEPTTAACVSLALAAGRPISVLGNQHTSAEMLSCGLASAPAIDTLLRHDVRSVVVDEDELELAVITLARFGGPCTTPSGAAGLAGMLKVAGNSSLRAVHRIKSDSSVLLVVTEAAIESAKLLTV